MNAYDLPPSVEERIGSSQSHGRVDDPILALGMVGVTERDADTFLRLKWALDAKEYRHGVKAVFFMVRRLSVRKGWDLTDPAAELMAEAVLRWWLCPICPSCCGRGANPIENTPVLDDGCPDCQGSGKRPYPWPRGVDGWRHVQTLEALEEAEWRIRNKLIAKLGREIRDAGLLERGAVTVVSLDRLQEEQLESERLDDFDLQLEIRGEGDDPMELDLSSDVARYVADIVDEGY